MANPKRPRDSNQLARLIVRIATGETQDQAPDEGKDPSAVERGRKGGVKGGKARAAKLTADKLSQIGKSGAKARWGSEK